MDTNAESRWIVVQDHQGIRALGKVFVVRIPKIKLPAHIVTAGMLNHV